MLDSSMYRRASYNPAQFIGTTVTLTANRTPSNQEVQVIIHTRGALDFSLWLRTKDVAEYMFGELPDDEWDGDPRDAGAFEEQCRRDNPVRP